MATVQGQVAIPLVLPDSCNWDEQTGKCKQKPNVERETLNVVDKALDLLREIKGPVCVVSIAGPCRQGKSYIISKAFDQGEVFPLGHLFSPETMGIWMWIVPNKFKDSKGHEFTVVLLDSEGIDSVLAKRTDDYRVFTLSVLLSSIMIYNSSGVPNKSDLEGLDFIGKLSQRIQLHTNHTSETADRHFYEAFPNFIWLLRDVFLDLPTGCTNIKEYFLKIVFTADKESTEKSRNSAESILKYFSAFDAFCLPSPAYDPKVVKNLNDKTKEAQVNPKFLKGIKSFQVMLYSKLSPKKSINEGEYVTGEALASLVQLFVEALNTPGTVPNVQNAWDTFVLTKCTEALKTALTKYKDEMTSRVKDKIPCDADVIRAAHGEVMDMCLEMFNLETISLSIKSVDEYLKKLMVKTESFLLTLMEENKSTTEAYCINLLKNLKKTILDPVLAQLRGPEAAKMQFSEIVTSYNIIQQGYVKDGRGAKDVHATVFMNFHPEIQNEMKIHVDILQQMKDYDVSLAIEKADKAAQEEQTKKAEEENARLEKEKEIKKIELAILQEKQEKEKIRLQEMFEKNMSDQRDQLENMMQANFDEQRKEREVALKQQRTIENAMDGITTSLEKREGDIASLKFLNAELQKKFDDCIFM